MVLEVDSGDWTPFSARPEWRDVEPIPQRDGPRPVVPIAYTSQFREVMDYFRAVLAKDERSLRALDLTCEVIALNAANYTVWHFRRLVLEALSSDLQAELEYIASIAETNHKNYQIWHHRRWVAQRLGANAVSLELRFTEDVLVEDPKNYHAWSHRQWVLQELGGWDSELDYCSKLLRRDLLNNSAWNQRFFVVSKSPSLGGLQCMRDSELQYCVEAIKLVPTNESPWRYLRGLFKGEQAAFVGHALVGEVCVAELGRDPTSVQALSLLLDLLSAGFQPNPNEKEMLCKAVPVWSSPFELASWVCSRLESVDAMRSQYWAWRGSQLPFTLPISS